MVFGKKWKVFIGTFGMMRGKKLIVFMVQLARSWVQLARKVKILWVIELLCGYSRRKFEGSVSTGGLVLSGWLHFLY